MLILGIDPGSRVTGYGLVTQHRGLYRLIHAGVIQTNTDAPIPERLLEIHRGLRAVLEAHSPQEAAIEAIFRHKSSESALRLGQARGVALLALAQSGLTVHEYNAMTVKKSVTGAGKADKEQVARVVQMLLGRELTLPADATDAIAIAITHLAHSRHPLTLRRNPE